MAYKNRGANAYRNVDVSSAVPYADSVQLIQMLFDGLMASLAVLKVISIEMILRAKTTVSVEQPK